MAVSDIYSWLWQWVTYTVDYGGKSHLLLTMAVSHIYCWLWWWVTSTVVPVITLTVTTVVVSLINCCTSDMSNSEHYGSESTSKSGHPCPCQNCSQGRRASSRKDWKRIQAESPLKFPWWPNRSRGWAECRFCRLHRNQQSETALLIFAT